MISNSTHPLQSRQWGEFRKKTEVKVVETPSFLLTIHKIPYLSYTIGYLPKGHLPSKEMIDELRKIGKENKCIFIQLEPNIICHSELVSESPSKKMLNLVQHDMSQLGLRPSAHPLFTKYTFILDLTKSENELLKNMHPKTRYNIKIAQKHNVEVIEDNSDAAFEEYIRLTKETTRRQGFYAHTENYHRLMWETLKTRKMEDGKWKMENNLSAHLFLANYTPPKTTPYPLHPIPLTAWIIFVLGDTMYYPYGASSNEHRETMASNLMMWDVIRWGKRQGLKEFDMWGALGPNPNPKDPWFGFHRFKEGYGGKLTESVGSFDLVINPLLYELYKVSNKLRWIFLRFKK